MIAHPQWLSGWRCARRVALSLSFTLLAAASFAPVVAQIGNASLAVQVVGEDADPVLSENRIVSQLELRQ